MPRNSPNSGARLTQNPRMTVGHPGRSNPAGGCPPALLAGGGHPAHTLRLAAPRSLSPAEAAAVAMALLCHCPALRALLVHAPLTDAALAGFSPLAAHPGGAVCLLPVPSKHSASCGFRAAVSHSAHRTLTHAKHLQSHRC